LIQPSRHGSTYTMEDEEFDRGARKLLLFQKAHPELKDALALWMADRSTCEAVHPDAAEIFKREMAEYASDRLGPDSTFKP
jgi:hypothetical protein